MRAPWNALERRGFEDAAFEILELKFRGGARLLRMLVERPGHELGDDHLMQALAHRKRGGLTRKSVNVYACLLRTALADVGFDGAILTHRPCAYSMPASTAAEIRAFVEAAA